MSPNLKKCENRFGFTLHGNKVYICLGIPELTDKNDYRCFGIEVDDNDIPVANELKILVWNDIKGATVVCDAVLSFNR